MTVVHTPWSAAIHAGLTVLGYYYHRDVLHTGGIPGLHPLAVGPGVVGLVEPCVSGGCSLLYFLLVRSALPVLERVVLRQG